jgi:hypothetical protein
MVPALIVGALTGWYLGLRIGIIVGVAVAAALLVSMVVPGMSLAIYALVVMWCAALYFFGAKISKMTGRSSVAGTVSGTVSGVSAWAKRFLGPRG